MLKAVRRLSMSEICKVDVRELTFAELNEVVGGAGAAASAAGTTSASAASGEALGVTVVTVGTTILFFRGDVTAGGGQVLGPTGVGAAAGGS